MRTCRPLILAFACVLGMGAAAQQAAPQTAQQTTGPALLPGEGLALGVPDGSVYGFGETRAESPMGNLALFAWLRLEGQAWGAMSVQFVCTGAWHGVPCWKPKGHGKEDLARALQEDCRLAFFAWGQMSAQMWREDYGDGPARARLDEVFGPFTGNRVPGTDMPAFTLEWFGTGDLLRTSPEGMVRWLVDPAQEQMVRQVRRLLVGKGDAYYDPKVWWIQAGEVTGPGGAGTACAWAVGGNNQVVAVLRLPSGKSRADALSRFRTLLVRPAGK